MDDSQRLFERALATLDRYTPLSDLVHYRGDVVLMYHAIDRGWRSPHSLPLDTFRRQMAVLSEEHNVVPLDELATEPNAASRRVAITFDDGYRDFHDTVLPILRDYDLPATVFVSPAFLGDENLELAHDRFGVLTELPDGERAFMTRDELRQAASSDLVTVGNHTLTHPDLSACLPEEYEREINQGHDKLTELLDQQINLFSYPYGSYTAEMFNRLRSVVRKSHDVAVTSRRGHVTTTTDRLLLNRIEPPVEMSLFELRVAPLYGHAITIYRRVE